MYGVETIRGWLSPTSGPGKFFNLHQHPVYPFRDEHVAKELAQFFLGGKADFEVIEQPARVAAS